jgi:mycothiol system anti-sigma-R factor
VSCGNAHATDCAKVIEQVYLYLDGELPDDDCAELRTHLEDCAPCLREYGLEQAFKALVARSCPCDETPPDFKEKVLDKLREVRAEIAQVEYQPE